MSPVLGKCIAAVTKVTLADFQLFFPASVSTSSLLLGGRERDLIGLSVLKYYPISVYCNIYI